MKGSPVLISPEAAQKTFDKEEASNEEDSARNEVQSAISDEIEQPTKAPLWRPQNSGSKVKNEVNNVVAPKVEVKPVKIEVPQSEPEPKLAPIPMAKPF